MGCGGEETNLFSEKETKEWGERVDADPHMYFQEQNFSALGTHGDLNEKTVSIWHLPGTVLVRVFETDFLPPE